MNYSESAVLNALQGSAVILDEEGNIALKNKNWYNSKNSLSLCNGKVLSENYFEHCNKAVEEGSDYALRLLLGVRDVLDGKKEHFNISVNIQSENTDRWFKVEVSPVQHESKNHVLLVFNDVTDEVNKIHSSRQTEALYRQNFKYSNSGVILGKANGEILDANPAACSILGYTREELLQSGRGMIVDEEDPAHREVVRIRNTKSVFRGEKEYKHKDGHYIPVQLTSIKYQSTNDETHIINTFREIQHEKDGKHTLEVERRFTKTALNSISGIFFVLNSDRKFVRWNNSMHTDLGYSNEEMTDKSIHDIFEPSQRKTIERFIRDAFKNGKASFNGKVISKHSGVRHYNLQFNTFQNKERCYLVVTGVDRTDFVESEILREQNYRLLTELFDNSSIATVMIDPQDKAKKVNKAFIDLFGYDEDELLDENVNSLLTTKDLEEEAELISRHAFAGNPDQRTALRIRKDGTEVPVLLSTVPVQIEGKIIAVYGMYVDLTEQVHLKNHLQKSLDEKDVLLQEVHHRVKNNLAIMASLLQLQILNDCNESAKPKLQEAYGRIFSIAKVHEALYKKEDIAEISFADYLNSIVETMPNVAKTQDFNIRIQKEETPLILSVNQAIPLGLLINEIMNLTSQTNQDDQPVQLSFSCNDEIVTISMSGMENQVEVYNSDSNKSDFHRMLIKTFLQQIDATIEINHTNEKSFVITFKKSKRIKGSSNSLTIQENHKLKKSVA